MAVRGRGGRRSVGGLLCLMSWGLGTLSDSHAGTLAAICVWLACRPSLCAAGVRLAKSDRSAADGLLSTNGGFRLACGMTTSCVGCCCCWATGGGGGSGGGGAGGGDGNRCVNNCEDGGLADRTAADADAGRAARARGSCGAADVPRASASPGRARVTHTHFTRPPSPARGERVGTAASRGGAFCAVRPLGCRSGVGASCATVADRSSRGRGQRAGAQG